MGEQAIDWIANEGVRVAAIVDRLRAIGDLDAGRRACFPPFWRPLRPSPLARSCRPGGRMRGGDTPGPDGSHPAHVPRSRGAHHVLGRSDVDHPDRDHSPPRSPGRVRRARCRRRRRGRSDAAAGPGRHVSSAGRAHAIRTGDRRDGQPGVGDRPEPQRHCELRGAGPVPSGRGQRREQGGVLPGPVRLRGAEGPHSRTRRGTGSCSVRHVPGPEGPRPFLVAARATSGDDSLRLRLGIDSWSLRLIGSAGRPCDPTRAKPGDGPEGLVLPAPRQW